MLRLEEYITKRKKEDQMNEFDIKAKDDNMQKSINYVFEYFSNYLDLENYNEEMYSQNLKVRGYEKQLTDYEPPVREYLLWYYKVYGKRLKRPFEDFLKKDPNFLLKSGETHFRDTSYEMYAKFNKKYEGIKTNVEGLYLYIKDRHRIMSNDYNLDNESIKNSELNLPKRIVSKLNQINSEYKVNLQSWAWEYLGHFLDNPSIWDSSQRIKNKYYDYDYSNRRGNTDRFRYDYDYSSNKNPFGINDVYSKFGSLPYIKGNKKLLLSLIRVELVGGYDEVDLKLVEKWQKDIDSL